MSKHATLPHRFCSGPSAQDGWPGSIFFGVFFARWGVIFGGIWRAGNAARTQQLALNVVFGVVGFATVWLAGLEPSILEHS